MTISTLPIITRGSHPADLRFDFETKKWWRRQTNRTRWHPKDGDRCGKPLNYEPNWAGWLTEQGAEMLKTMSAAERAESYKKQSPRVVKSFTRKAAEGMKPGKSQLGTHSEG